MSNGIRREVTWTVLRTIGPFRPAHHDPVLVPLLRLGLGWVLFVLVLFSFVSTKLPHYSASVYIPISMWAAAMLDPAFRDINNSLVNAGHVDREFYNRPASYTDSETLKTVILMTDGANDNSFRISNTYYNEDSEYVHWNRYNLWWYLRREVNSRYWGYFYYQKYNLSLIHI